MYTVPGRFPVFLSLHRMTIACTAIGFLLLCNAVTRMEGERIQDEVGQRVRESVSIPGAEKVEVEVEGRNLVIHGTVSNESAKNQLEQSVSALSGIRSIGFDLDILPTRTSYIRIVRNHRGELRLEGELPRASQVDSVLRIITGEIEHDRLVDDLVVNPDVADPHWYDMLMAVLRAVEPMERFTLDLGVGRVILGGFLEDRTVYDTLVESVRQLATDSEMGFVNRVGSRPATD
ncbi:MAG: BON domain-containing protein [Gammaproteobacteria bacterium]|nr:BON domain-containing protein [Gammaproteobacteria bacterium]MYD76011.1 BON domain-containing protein [Gammaproteobacteria bacterium]MYJ52219.1 BON domain-containing protein [Gammaproteobacteria bacterium]